MRVAVVMIAAGLIISACAMAAMGFDITKLNTAEYVTNTYAVGEDFSGISVKGAECDIGLYPSEDGTCRVVCHESDRITHTISVDGGTLTIERHDGRRWYEHLGIHWGSMEIALYLPESDYEFLHANSVSGDIVVPEGFVFGAAEAYSTSGDVTFQADVRGALSLRTVSGDLHVGHAEPDSMAVESTSGDIEVENVRAKGDVTAKSVSGDIELENVTCRDMNVRATSGCVRLSGTIAGGGMNIETVSGDIGLRGCDAENLWLKAVSGEIYGTLLSDKTFITHTTSGYVDVPPSAGSGECQVRTVSGDIEFAIQ